MIPGIAGTEEYVSGWEQGRQGPALSGELKGERGFPCGSTGNWKVVERSSR